MSAGQKVAFWVWTVFVISVAILVDGKALETKEYSGQEIEISASAGYIIEIDSTSAEVEAGASSYFRMVQNGKNFYGIPETPLGGDDHFYNSDTLSSGRWEITEGTGVSLRMRPSDGTTLTVRKWPVGDTGFMIMFITFLAGAIVWIVGILVGSHF